MHDRVLRRMRELVRASKYVLTVHAEEEMESDNLSVLDIEQCILSGRIVERQKDRMTGEWKYVIHGSTVAELDAAVVAKVGPTDKVIVLTVFVL